ncbi:ubiquinone/menaquinone biosynthesis C-methylase UbiE [Herbihabitans rhizosphaerae]|uniref:Ubiquinone/menaquinone biosynthesis C-methylase UbiE n=1 Tax=Herbihabitans rhizosphaerae TaxID=1872711 RepID=A0A4Q7KGP6_9PSEU|nr:methyltransferase domain-containing protein [Herbihabitans rhizosphaerae]RZS34041.1 ubiquinone/menaquinone biosynthesis C-methylase UbiE [Herbihabitans rhizosphaerae]
MTGATTSTAATRKLLTLLDEPPAEPDVSRGYLDLLDEGDRPDPGLIQRLMRTSLVPRIYEHYWRPSLARLAKGPIGPSMAGEHRIASDMLALRPGDTALDVACGTGAFTRTFARTVGSDGLAIGLDASPTMLARAVAETNPANVAYLRGDAVHPPLRASIVDGLCCYAALHLFADPAAALDGFARVLKPGGRLTVLTTLRPSWQPLRAVDSLSVALSGQRMFDRDELANLLRNKGFGDIDQRAHGVIQIVGATKE